MLGRRTAALGALAPLLALGGCGGDATVSTTGPSTSTGTRPQLRCSSGAARMERDGQGDVTRMSSRGPETKVRLPAADLLAVTVRHGDDGVICVSYRLASPVRLGSEFAFETRSGADRQRYEIQLTPDGRVHASRPHGEPRYPVRARVARRGDVLEVAMQTLLRSGQAFAWRVETRYLPRLPLGDIYRDALPGGLTWIKQKGSPS